MRGSRKQLVWLGLMVLGGSLAASTNSAAAPEPWTFTPSTVSDGSAVTATGTGCVDPATGSADGLHVVVFAEGLYHPYSGDTTSRLIMTGDPAADGSWSVAGTVSTFEGYSIPHEDFVTTATAFCYGDVLPATEIGSALTIQYKAQVDPLPTTTDPGGSTTTTPATTPTSTPSTTSPGVTDPSVDANVPTRSDTTRVAVPASPVRAAAALTG